MQCPLIGDLAIIYNEQFSPKFIYIPSRHICIWRTGNESRAMWNLGCFANNDHEWLSDFRHTQQRSSKKRICLLAVEIKHLLSFQRTLPKSNQAKSWFPFHLNLLYFTTKNEGHIAATWFSLRFIDWWHLMCCCDL